MIEFVVWGVPIQKGSARAFMPKGWTRPVITSDTRRGLKEWEHAIRVVAQEHAGQMFTEAVHVDLLFVLPRPKSLPKRVRHHLKKPDIDKLSRAALDAMTGIVWKDDSQVVALQAHKRYPETESEGSRLEVRVKGFMIRALPLAANA